jgi:hypothetical protein
MALTRPRYSQIYDTDYKQSVRVATTADVGNLLATGNMTNTVDEVVLSALDRVLVKDQIDARQNGIYIVVTVGTGSNGTWERSRDANASDKVTSGMSTVISEGSVNSFKTFKLATVDPITLGTTELTFVNPFSAGVGTVAGPNGSVQFNDLGTAGGTSGLTFNKTSNLLSVGGNVSSSGYFIGDGSQLTGIIAGTNYGNTNVAAYLPTHTGNVSANYFIGNVITTAESIEGALFVEDSILNLEAGTSNLRIYSSNDIAISSNGIANVLVVNTDEVGVTGNVSANYFIGDGSQLTGIIAGTNYGDSNVAAYLPTHTGNVSANYFIGNLITDGASFEGALFVEDSILNLEAGTSNLRIYSSNDIAISSDGIANILVIGANTTTITGNLLPSANVTYDLGSPTQRWRTGYFASNTLDLGGSTISIDPVNGFTFSAPGLDSVSLSGSESLTADIANLYANAGVQAGQITTANTAMKSYVDSADTVLSNQISGANAAIVSANTAMKSYVDSADTVLSNQISGANAAITTANVNMKGYVDGTISNLLNGAPATLDTLNEIAAALGNDANLSVTLTNQIAGVQGNVNAANAAIVSANTAMKGYVDAINSTLTSNAAVQAGAIADTNTAITTANTAMKGYVDAINSTLTSNAAVQAGAIADTNTAITTANTAMKGYVDSVANLSSYSNANVSAYLPTHSGNISAANVNVSGNLTIGGVINNPTVTNYTESVVAIGTVTTSNTLSLINGTVQTATLTASTACTFTMPTPVAGKSFILLLKQAAVTGNGTATFTGVKFNSIGAPTITAAAGKMDILSFISDGTNWYGSYTQGYTP